MNKTDLLPTRAQCVSVSPKTLAARTRRTLKSVRKQLQPLAQPYIDVDNSVEGALDDLLTAFDAFEKHIEDTVTWLNEQPGS